MARFNKYQNFQVIPNYQYDLIGQLQSQCAAMWEEIVDLKGQLYCEQQGLKFSLRTNDYLRTEVYESKKKLSFYQRVLKENCKPCKCAFSTEKALKRIVGKTKKADFNQQEETGFIFLQPSQLKSIHTESDTNELEQHAVNGPAKPLDVNGDDEKVTKKVKQTAPEAEDVNEARTRPDESKYETMLVETEETDEPQVSSSTPEAHSPWSTLRQSWKSVKKFFKRKH